MIDLVQASAIFIAIPWQKVYLLPGSPHTATGVIVCTHAHAHTQCGHAMSLLKINSLSSTERNPNSTRLTRLIWIWTQLLSFFFPFHPRYLRHIVTPAIPQDVRASRVTIVLHAPSALFRMPLHSFSPVLVLQV